MRRWAARLGIVVSAVTALAGCALPSSQDEVLPTRFVEPPQVTPAAQAAFGDKATQAYTEIVEWSMAQWLRDPLLDPQDTTSVNVQVISEGITDHMIPGTAQDWSQLTAKAINGDERARHSVQLLRFHDWYQVNLQKPGTSPIRSQAINRGIVDVAPAWENGIQPIQISFEQTARIELLNRRDPYPATVTKHITFTVVPASTVTLNTPTAGATTSTTPTAVSSTAAATPTSTSTAATASTTGSTRSVEPTIGTLENSVGVVNPGAAWLIATFDGDIDVAFDKDRTERPTARGRATAGSTSGATPVVQGGAN